MTNRYFLYSFFKIIGVTVIAVGLVPYISKSHAQSPVLSTDVRLQLLPGPNNPRNSEGDFVELKDGRILYIYSRFTGASASDFGSSDLAARWSEDGGKTWKNIKAIHTDPDGYYCYTAARFTATGQLLLSYCASKRAQALTSTNISLIPKGWLYEK